jgi:uncharacterized membrane protein YbaN (DUF454 family)
VRKKIYKPLGFVFLTLAAVGAVLPVLPTTPFLLLAAWFFARSSQKWHRWLLDSDVFGPLLNDWETRRCLTRKTKISALMMMTLVGGSSIWFALDDSRLRLIAGILIAIGCATVLAQKTCPDCESVTSTR